MSRCNYVSIETLRYSPPTIIIRSTNKNRKKYAFLPVAITIADYKSYKYILYIYMILRYTLNCITSGETMYRLYTPTNLIVTISYPPTYRGYTEITISYLPAATSQRNHDQLYGSALVYAVYDRYRPDRFPTRLYLIHFKMYSCLQI